MASRQDATEIRPPNSLDEYRRGPLAPFVESAPTLIEITAEDSAQPGTTAAVVLAAHRLQYLADYRRALQRWFAAVEQGGHLLVTVSHAFLYERQLALPSRWSPQQRRLYTPRSLMDEVEEALAPNSYRVRLLADDDRDYDYTAPLEAEPKGHGEIVLVLEKITAPDWPLADPPAPRAVDAPREPDFAFDPPRTRVERAVAARPQRILILKLDHLGDFVISIAALRKAREAFPDAEITLVVGSWNVAMARELGLADAVIAFDAFPRNSTEEEPDPRGTVALFNATVTGEYDLAIDLRTDHDTRLLLRDARAAIKAGIGTRAQFPFLDIFLPIDASRNEPETASDVLLSHHHWNSQGSAERTRFRISSAAEGVERDCAIVWGPYRRLRPGRYFFEPHVEFSAKTGGGLVMLDVAIDTRRVAQHYAPGGDQRLWFRVGEQGGQFEFRIWAVDDQPSVDLDFFGGRLVRAGAASVLHQHEYQALLIELVRMRMHEGGMLADARS